MDATQLSDGAKYILESLLSDTPPDDRIPKFVVDFQWSPESKQEMQELIDAGLVEEVVFYQRTKRNLNAR